MAERSTLISLQPFLASSSDVDPLAAAITESTLKVLNDAGSHASAARPGDRAPFVLAGTARSSGNRIRVVATLTAANSADPLWTRTIDAERHHDHLFDLADAIAARIAWPIADTFGVVGSRSNDGDAGALDRYRRLFESLSTDASREVCSLLDTRLGTVGPDPRVRAALSDALFTAWWLDLDAPAGALDRAEDLAAAAIAADPTAPEGHLAAAYVHYGRGRTRLFELELDAALAASQDSPHLAVSSGLLRVLVGDIDAGLELLRHGVELNPNLPAWWHVGTCVAAVDRGDLEAALVEAVQVGDTAAHIGPFLRLALKSLLGHDDTSSDAKCLLEFDDRYGDRLDERLGRVIRIDTVRNRLIEAVRASGTLPIADAP